MEVVRECAVVSETVIWRRAGFISGQWIRTCDDLNRVRDQASPRFAILPIV